MMDVTTQKRLEVQHHDPARPYVWTPFVQLADVRRVLDLHSFRYTVGSNIISLNGGPEVAVIRFRVGTDPAAVQAAMRQTQCWDWRDRPLGQLSGGERQRVLLARALAVGAPVLVMDEPLANLDPPHQADWLAIVRRHVARGGTAVSVLHEIGMALQADDLVLLADGRVAHHGGTADAATHRAIVQVFDGRVEVHAVAGRWVALPREKEWA